MDINLDEIVIREAVPEEAKRIRELIREAMEFYRRASGINSDVLESLTESVDSVRERIRRHHCLVAILGEKPIGTITVSYCDNPMKYSFSVQTARTLREYRDCAYISRFAVEEEYRDTGLGVALMNEALRIPVSTRSGLVLLHTAISNIKMRDFYINRGFMILDSEDSRGYERGLFAYMSDQNRRDDLTA
ncbi:MAG: GNAT family N-acetyltransferase [Clostridiales bacterium]|nr:GNAT family N-acetyltransferase [Clostridiales bacterium]